jgi:hypothetical protein
MELRRFTRVIRSWEDCNKHIPPGPVFLEVQGAWVGAVFSLVKISEKYRDKGLIVTEIGPESQGAKGGLVRGDVLLRYDGVELESAGALKRLIKRHAESGGTSRPVMIEAVRGSEDLSFEVAIGLLGITVSPSLYRLQLVGASPSGAQKPDRKETGAKTKFVMVKTPEQAQRHDPSQPALVEVPGELVRKVLLLLMSLNASGKLKKRAKALLSTVWPKQDRQ